MTFLRSLDRLLTRIEFGFLVLLFSAIVVLSFSQVVLRNLFDTGFLWADTLIRHLVLWVGFIGAALAAGEERHIGIDAVTHFLSFRGRSIIRIFTYLFAIFACYYLADAALTFLIDERDSGSAIMFSIPTWTVLLVIPIGYGLMAVHFSVKLVEHAIKASGKTVEIQ
jgi:TRAP-type C4-dicarboxylate transport system permease small subunit